LRTALVVHELTFRRSVIDQCIGLSDEPLTEAFDIGQRSVLETLTQLVNVIGFWMADEVVVPASPG